MLQSDPPLRRSFRRRATALFLAVWFAFLSLAVPVSVSAQGAVSVPVLEGIELKRETKDAVERALRDSWGFQAQVALINAMQFFGERIAYETAVWVASGGKAQSQLFDRRSWDTFLADSLFGAGLNFINDMDTFASGQWGFDTPFGVAQFICSPTIPELRLALKLGLQDRLKPRTPLCTFSQFRDNWAAFTSEENLAKSLSGIGIAFEPGESDLSAGLDLHAGIGGQIADKQLANIGKRLQDKGYLPTSEQVSGATKTPASVVQAKIEEDVALKGPKTQKEVATGVKDSVASVSTFGPMLSAMAQALAINFAVTLASQTLQQQVLNRGLFVGDLIGGPDRNLAGSSPTAGPPAAGRRGAEAVFAEFVRPRVVTSGDYDQLTQFASCDPQNRQITSCVIDDGFTQAVRRSQTGQAMTVSEALEATFLHGNWPFIPGGTGEDQDPNCYQDAYCGSNLVKLRQARIIPIGWELAAGHAMNVNPNDRLTLAEVVAAFHANGNDGVCGNGDAGESPLCGLIDPDWVLRYPDQQCRLRGPSELLIQANTNVRSEACTDAPSCLETDAEGKCVGGYGYCLAERNIWHISGRSCPAAAVSCRALVNRQGEELAVLTSTVDRGQCNAENVGCRWYSTTRDASGTWLAGSGNRRYFNRNIEQCQANAEGCTELLAVAAAGRNFVRNASFEVWPATLPPTEWITITPAALTRVESPTQDGTNAMQVSITAATGGDVQFAQSITVTQRGPYTISAAVRLPTPGAGGVSGTPSIELRQGTTTVCTASVASPPLDTWVQMSATCTLEPETYGVAIRFAATGASAVFVDSVQVELGTSVTAFHEGYRPDTPRTYLRAAPNDLRCYDLNGDGTLNTANDPVDGSCSQFALGCTEAEVGCERYTPADGTPSVNGQVNDIDRCPKECVGYAAFREVNSDFDRRSDFDYFIPSTARQCTVEEIGCSEFTNLDALERGGEQREFFSFLRRCEKPNTVPQATYYTWEGSDQQGFQLRSFVLRSSTSDANSAPAVFETTDPWSPTAPPTFTDPRDCRYSTDPLVRADCRAFYSQSGAINHRQLSRTTLITDDCVRYRPSHQIPPETCTDLGGAVT
ncbi:hypothetical protein HY634_02205, partial [Candidatus Uhrbacteria bacterium]|nr:hypothetical protein [Candidatus Uhrbacteria bacterium]